MLDTLSMMLSCQFQNVLLVQGSLVNLMILKISLKKELEMLTLLNNGVNSTYHLSLLSTGIIKCHLQRPLGDFNLELSYYTVVFFNSCFA